MKKFLIVFLLAITTSACMPDGRVYEDHQKLSPDYEWLKKDTRTFEVPITDISKTYNFSLSFRYANGFPFQEVNVRITETSPSGKKSITEHALKVRQDNGDYIGNPGYDIWDSEHLIIPNKKYTEKGTYHYKIEHIMPVDPLNFAMEIGVILDEVKKSN